MDAAEQFLLKTMSFFPLGVLSGAWPANRRRPYSYLIGAAAVFLIAVFVEAGQLLVIGRSPSLSDAIIFSMGGWAGMAIVARFEQARRVFRS